MANDIPKPDWFDIKGETDLVFVAGGDPTLQRPITLNIFRDTRLEQQQGPGLRLEGTLFYRTGDDSHQELTTDLAVFLPSAYGPGLLIAAVAHYLNEFPQEAPALADLLPVLRTITDRIQHA